MPRDYPYLDASRSGTRRDKDEFRRIVQRTSNFTLGLPEHMTEEAQTWYPSAHEEAVRGGKELGIGTHRAAGIISALSSGSDWDTTNRGILGEVTKLDEADWESINRAAQVPRIRLASGRTVMPQRPQEVSDMLREKSPGLSQATVAQLSAAHRLLTVNGSTYDEILARGKNLKRHSFAHNIEHPETSPHITIDYHIADLLHNTMKGSDQKRGLDALGRYASHEEMVRQSAAAHRAMTGSNLSDLDYQALAWLGAKAVERPVNPETGVPRGIGVTRVGQPYFNARGVPEADLRNYPRR